MLTQFVFPQLFARFKHQSGQTMTEYAVALGAIVLATVAVVGLLSAAVVTRFGNVASTIKGIVP